MTYEDRTKLQITADGIKIPDIETIYNAVIEEWNDAFGGNLRTENRLSPQGQLAMSITRQIDNKNKALLYFINQFNMNTATGNFLDYQYNNFGIYRTKGSKSTVICQCTLEIGTTINIGDQIQNNNGDIFISTEEYIAQESEPQVFEVNFESADIGAIECGAHTLTTIITQKEGWISVDNAEAGIAGGNNTHSTVTCQCVLTAGTSIEIGDIIANTNNQQFKAVTIATYPTNTDIANIYFMANKVGAIECKAHTLTTIITQKEGWISVDNNNNGSIGQDNENDDQFRIRAMNSHNINAIGTEKSIYAKLMELDEIEDVYIQSNRTKRNITEDGVTITANSTYICVNGDNSKDTIYKIAQILHLVASATTYIGDIKVSIPIENAPNNVVDDVYFSIATRQNIYLSLTIKTLSYYSKTTDNTIKQIILKNFNGEVENIQKCRIGDIIEANRFFENLVYLQGTNEAIVESIEISLDNNNWQKEVKIPITSFPFMDEENITIIKD